MVVFRNLASLKVLKSAHPTHSQFAEDESHPSVPRKKRLLSERTSNHGASENRSIFPRKWWNIGNPFKKRDGQRLVMIGTASARVAFHAFATRPLFSSAGRQRSAEFSIRRYRVARSREPILRRPFRTAPFPPLQSIELEVYSFVKDPVIKESGKQWKLVFRVDVRAVKWPTA